MKKSLENGSLPITHQQIRPGRIKVGNYLKSDPAYPITPYCVREYSTCSSYAEVIFNNMLRSSCNQIKCVFGQLKAC